MKNVSYCAGPSAGPGAKTLYLLRHDKFCVFQCNDAASYLRVPILKV